MVKTIIEGLHLYFLDCPLLEDGKLNVDYLPEDTKKNGIEFAITIEPAEQVIKRYKDGTELCRYPFIISSVFDYGSDALNQISNTGFFEELSKWIKDNSRNREFPDLPKGMTPKSMEAVGTGYLFEPNADSGKYQIQCNMEYYKE